VDDSELRAAIIEDLSANRTAGAGGVPLLISDANLAERLACDTDQLNAVLASLMEDGVVHGRRRSVVSTGVQMEWDCLRLAEDPLPDPDPRELD
jgi:hypothetical protein